MQYRILTNPDSEYTRKKRKLIKKNNGFCPGEAHIEQWRCPCQAFRSKTTSGWCGEGLYYKEVAEPAEPDGAANPADDISTKVN